MGKALSRPPEGACPWGCPGERAEGRGEEAREARSLPGGAAGQGFAVRSPGVLEGSGTRITT